MTTLPSPPSLLIGVLFTPSKYSRKKIRIYRADIIGGTVWAFIWNGEHQVCDTLQTAYGRIDLLARKVPMEEGSCSQ